MMRKSAVLLGLAGGLLLALSAQGATADELPLRKPGLWEMRTSRAGSPVQQCTDGTTDRDLTSSLSLAKQVCSRQDVQKTATGYTVDAVCRAAGVSITSHSEISGDFNSAYTVTTKSHASLGKGRPHDSVSTIEAKWIGACKPGQKPGDIVMPGGIKVNTGDLNKLKALLPGVK